MSLVAVVVSATFSLILGLVSVLLVSVSLPARVVSVPVVGIVTLVMPVAVSVIAKPPEVAKPAANDKFPARSMVLLLLFTLNVRMRCEFSPESEASTSSLTLPVSLMPRATAVLMLGAVSVLLVSVSMPVNVARVPVVGSVTFVAPVAVSVVANAPEVMRELPVANVSVAPTAGAVMVTLLIEVAVAAPRAGAVSTGAVSVLLVSVSVVSRPTIVSVAAGSVNVALAAFDVVSVACVVAPSLRMIVWPACASEPLSFTLCAPQEVWWT